MSSCHLVDVRDDTIVAQTRGEGTILVALAGQPNVGKSTVFNLLTGLSQHVGNWPGKTIEQKTGTHRHNGTTIHLVDLPGTYSLTASSPISSAPSPNRMSSDPAWVETASWSS